MPKYELGKKYKYYVEKGIMRKMKKIITSVLLSVMVIGLFAPIKVNAQANGTKQPQVERTWDYQTKDLDIYICGNGAQTQTIAGTAAQKAQAVVAIRNTAKEVKIPEKVTCAGVEYTVTGIVANAKEYNVWYADELKDLNRDIQLYNKNTKTEVVSIPKTVISIEAGALNRFTKLKKIVVSKDNTNFKSVKGALLSKDGKIFYAGPKIKSTYYVPAGVKTIASRAFAYGAVKKVVLPKTCTTIKSRAFYKCTKLRSINLKKVKSLGANVFFKTKIKNVNKLGNIVSEK